MLNMRSVGRVLTAHFQGFADMLGKAMGTEPPATATALNFGGHHD